ncbi:MAG: hypothetical protein M0Q88_02885 [Bacilli bacterium]|nr:hypothetical protein [Bacilli bacterium]
MKTILIDDKLYKSGYLIQTFEGQKILKKANEEKKTTGKTNVYCICKGMDDKVPMHTKKNPFSNSYTLGRNPHTKHLHHPECVRHFDEIIKEEKGKEHEEKEKLRITKDRVVGERWEECNLYLGNYIIRDLELEPSETLDKDIVRERKISLYSTLYSLMEKATTFAWYKYVTNHKNPANPKEGNLFHIIYTELYDMKIKNPNVENEKGNKQAIELGKLLFKPYNNIKNENITKQLSKERIHLVNGKLEKFKTIIIGKYLEHKSIDEKNIEIKVLDPYLKNYYFIYTKPNIFNTILRKQVNGADLYIVAYLDVIKGKPIILEANSMAVLKNRGIYVESTYEIEFAKHLIKNNKFFIRPPKSEYIFHNIFKRYIPDFIILNTETRDFEIISEVFGYKRDDLSYISKKYWENTEKKLEYYKTLENKYKYIHWYAAEMKKLPYIQTKDE